MSLIMEYKGVKKSYHREERGLSWKDFLKLPWLLVNMADDDMTIVALWLGRWTIFFFLHKLNDEAYELKFIK